MMVASYFIGQYYYPIKYPLKEIGAYTLLAIVLYAVGMYAPIENDVIKYALRTTLLIVYVASIAIPVLKARRA